MIDFPRFEEEFKLGGGEVATDDMADGTPTFSRRASKRPETVSLLDPNRIRNVGEGLFNLCVIHVSLDMFIIVFEVKVNYN